ncbi:MAG: hypothetical protein JO211_00200, partial [Acidobacteriaceae bacterium]|nr:hypothetical protein [Acidobacteriaceae bacterium]
MKICLFIAWIFALVAAAASAQNTFEITGTPIPTQLVKQNYGSVVKGVSAYDLNICNISDARQSLTSSKVYQALMQADAAIQPVGRQIMLASILRNQNRSIANVLNLAMSSASGALSLLNTSAYRLPPNWSAAAALAAITGQQLMSNFKPVLSADQLEKFESQVLEPALVMDSGSCVERTVFTIGISGTNTKPQGLNFRVR